MSIEIDGARCAGLPPSVDGHSGLVHGPPVLSRRRLSALELADASTTHHDGRGRDMDLGLKLLQENGLPDMRRGRSLQPGARHTFRTGQSRCIEVCEDHFSDFGGQIQNGVCDVLVRVMQIPRQGIFDIPSFLSWMLFFSSCVMGDEQDMSTPLSLSFRTSSITSSDWLDPSRYAAVCSSWRRNTFRRSLFAAAAAARAAWPGGGVGIV